MLGKGSGHRHSFIHSVPTLFQVPCKILGKHRCRCHFSFYTRISHHIQEKIDSNPKLNLQTNKAFKETVGRVAGNKEENHYFYLEKCGNDRGSIRTETACSRQALQ